MQLIEKRRVVKIICDRCHKPGKFSRGEVCDGCRESSKVERPEYPDPITMRTLRRELAI